MEYRYGAAAESDWPQIIDWQTEIEWLGLPRARQVMVSRESVHGRVRGQVTHLRADEGFPNEALVAKTTSGGLAGYVWVAKTHNDRTGRMEGSLLGQFVAPEHRGQGLGGELLELAEAWAREQGLPCLCLFVSAQNTLAQRLYRSLGYEVVDLRMSKALD